MCFSASISYGTAAVLAGTGVYAVQQARQLPRPYLLWALIPVLFGIQQAFEGAVWQALAAGNVPAFDGAGARPSAVPLALGFHFFSHFLWPWWIPLCSYLVEPGGLRKRVFAGCTLFGACAGTLVYASMLLHPEWMSVAARVHSIDYQLSFPWRSAIHLPVTPAALYALTILVPLLCSSHRPIVIFGGLLAGSMLLASQAYGYAYVSVWCFFAAALSLYLVYMIRRLAVKSKAVGAA
jgi:hypothetical protein